MAFKSYLLFLTAILLCSHVFTKNINSELSPTTEIIEITESVESDESNESAEIIDRMSLYNDLVDRYKHHVETILEYFKIMLNDSIADISILKETNEKINETISEFKDIITQIEYTETSSDPDNFNKSVILLNSCLKYFDTFNTSAQENPKTEHLLIEMVLIKNELHINTDIYWEGFEDLMYDLHEHAAEYWDNLTEEEKEKDKDFKKWLTQYTGTETADWKQMYEEFVALYEDKK